MERASFYLLCVCVFGVVKYVFFTVDTSQKFENCCINTNCGEISSWGHSKKKICCLNHFSFLKTITEQKCMFKLKIS